MGTTTGTTSSQTQTMHAVVQHAYGSADVLHVEEIPRPTVGDHEVLIAVAAAGLDRGRWHLMAGKPYLTRLMGFGLRRPKDPVPGSEVAGTVVATGAAVTRFGPGDEVFGIAKGSFAEYSAAKEGKLARKPAGVSFEQAAAVGVSGLAALQAVRDSGRLQPGQQVLIIGASGGVGILAVQLAKAMGAEVTGVCSTAKVDLVTAAGADHAIDYTTDDFAAGTRYYDLVVDAGGNTALARLRQALTPRGTLVIVGGENGGRWTGGFGRQILRAPLLSLFVRQRLTSLMTKEVGSDHEVLGEFMAAGKLTPVIDRVYPLGEAADAMRRLQSGEARGKIVLQVAHPAG